MTLKFTLGSQKVAIVDVVQAVCRDKRIRMRFGQDLRVELLTDLLTATATVDNESDWGKESHLVFNLSRPSNHDSWLASGTALFRFGRSASVPTGMQGKVVTFDIVPVFASNRDDRLWRPARYSIRNMDYRGRHVLDVATQMRGPFSPGPAIQRARAFYRENPRTHARARGVRR